VFVCLHSWELSHGNDRAHEVIDDDDDDDDELVLKRVMAMMCSDVE
jgi:hypothetical protein